MQWPENMTDEEIISLGKVIECSAIENMAQLIRFIKREPMACERAVLIKESAKIAMDCAMALAFEMAKRANGQKVPENAS